MKTTTVLFLLIILFAKTNAQNYQISFAGSGASTTVDSVKIENLTQCTDTVITGSNVLNLTTLTGLNNLSLTENNSTYIFPNPMTNNCTIDFTSISQEKTNIELYNMVGKKILEKTYLLSKGHCYFTLSGINSGIYIFKIESGKYSFSSKIISNNPATGLPEINLISSVEQEITTHTENLKSINSTIDMQYNSNDLLKITGKSGNYRTVTMLIPTQNQTLTFNFVDCTDADNNHYSVIQIGNQLWMGENMKATKYRDGSNILNLQDSVSWSGTTSGAWCNYHNDPTEGANYGHLYNWYAATDNRNIAPVGWHVATNSEWNILEKFVDNTVDTTAIGSAGLFVGQILKENCNTRWQYFDSTAGWNSVGFTALCTNYRNSTGAWSLAPNNNHDCGFWTTTSFNTTQAWYRSFRWCTCDIYVMFPFKKSGNSIRCIHD